MTSTTTLTLADGLSATATSTFRSRHADETILPAEDWCPVFAYFNGGVSPKFNDNQIETIARQGADEGWCNLCDAPMVGDREAHVRTHLRQLASWRRTRGAAIDKARSERARNASAAKKDKA